MTDHYAWWRAALKGEKQSIHESEAHCGYYRKRQGRGGPFVPAAIWIDELSGAQQAEVNKSPADPLEVWTWICQHPISYDDYKYYHEHKTWPDTDPAIKPDTKPAIGDNNPPEDDDHAALTDQIDSAEAGVSKYAEINDDKSAKSAQSLRSRLNELSGKAEKIRETEKAPHLQAGKTVDAKWKPLVNKAKEAANTIRNALSAHETRKAHAEAEKQRKADEKRRKAEEEAAKAAAAGKPTPEPIPETEPEPMQSAPVTNIKGGYGRAAKIQQVFVAHVEDQDAAYQFLKGHPDLVEFIGKLAQRAVNAGREVPGVRIEEQRKVS